MKNKNENPIDGLFRRKLNEEQPAPDDLLWTEIESKLDEKKPSRRFGLWILVSAILLCSVASYFVFLNHSSINTTAVSEKVAPTENKISVNETPVNATSSSTSSTNSISTNNPSTINSTSSSNIKSNSNSIISNQYSTALKNNSLSGNKTTSARKYSSENSRSENKNSVKSSTDNSSNEIIEDENTGRGNSISENERKKDGNSSQAYISNSATEPINEKPLVANSTIGDENEKDEPLNSTQNQNPENEISNSSEIKTIPDTVAIVKTETPGLVNPIPVAPEKKLNWFVEVGSCYMKNTPALGFHGEYANPVEYEIDTLCYTARYKNEKSTFTFNYNFNIGMNIKNFQFKTGIDVIRFGENIQYSNQGLCFSIEGNPTIGYDTLQVHAQVNNSIGSRNGKSVNSYLGIPIHVNYSIPFKILKLQVGFGGFASTPVNWNSYYLNKNSTGLENPYALKMINTIVLGYTLNAGGAVSIAKHIDLEFGYFQRRTLSPIEKTEYGTKKVFRTSGVNIGFRYNFIKK